MHFRKLILAQSIFTIFFLVVILNFGILKADTIEGGTETVAAPEIIVPAEPVVIAPVVTNTESDTSGSVDLPSSTASTTPTVVIDVGTTSETSNVSTTPPLFDISTTSTSIPGESTASTSSSTPSVVSNIIDALKDAIAGVIDQVTNLVNGTSTPNTSGEETESVATSTIEILKDGIEATTTIEVTEQNTDSGKLVTVSALNEDPNTPIINVVATTSIPKIYKVGEENKIHIKWKNEGGQEMAFQAKDTNNDGYLDLLEWTIPHLSTQTFEIIFISKAFQLDENQNIIADIYDTVKTKDGNYVSLSNNQYIRVTFEQI
ncbi:MAG: hypothetical protein WCJ74_03845, partial [bacterium]